MKKKHALVLVLAAMLTILPVIAGCSKGQDQDASSPASASSEPFKLGEDPLQFSFYGNYDGFILPSWGKDPTTEWIQNELKVTVEEITNGGNAKQKFNTLLLSDKLPDVIWGDRGATVEKLREAGLLVPLDDYVDKYPNLKQWAGEATLNLLRSEDGKLYQFPNWYTKEPNGNSGYVVNKKIYKELGEPPLETTDDLYHYLKKVKASYPDVIPFEPGANAEGADILTSAFAENRPPTFNWMNFVPAGNELQSIFTDPTFREAMQFASKLYRERLMSQDAFSQNKDQIQEKIVSGRVAVYAASAPTQFGELGNAMLAARDPEAGYFMIWPIHKPGLDKNKIFPGDYRSLGWNVSVITTSAENPEAIFAFLDWMTGPEGQRLTMWGPEGLYWDGTDEDGAPKFTEKYTTDVENRNKLMDSIINLQWAGNTTYVDSSKVKFEKTLPEDKQSWTTKMQTEITWKTSFNTTEFVNLDPPGESDEGIIAQGVLDIYTKARAELIQNTKSDEEVLAILDKAEKDAQQIGYNNLLKYKTERWQANLNKLSGK